MPDGLGWVEMGTENPAVLTPVRVRCVGDSGGRARTSLRELTGVRAAFCSLLHHSGEADSVSEAMYL